MFGIKQESFTEKEEAILKLWKNTNAYRLSLENRQNRPLFATYDGPPFATGLPHYGHLLAGSIKDVILRYKTMQGFYVPRRFGWDCHGLPVENEIEKAKSLTGADTIESFGIGAFNEECRQIVLRYTNEWQSTVERMGRWVNFDDTYKTMDKSFMESVWWVFGQLWEKKLVYKGFKVMPFSAKLGTPLSNFEANLNYKDVDDPSLTVEIALDSEDASLLVWTTTPWTLVSNRACVVHPDLDYVKVQDKSSSKVYYIGKGRLSAYFNEDTYTLLEELKGKELIGKRYQPLFDYFNEHTADATFTILGDEFVGEEDGTGIVHAAPAFGEVDFFVCQKAGIELVCPVDQNGKFTKDIPEYEGLFVKDADKSIIQRLKEASKVFKHSQIHHRYPFCWRSDTPLLYKAVETWFVSVESMKEDLLKNNKMINWVPDHIQEGRFGNWLENARDWAISRNRYWGTPMPIWQSEDGDTIVISSVEELEKRTGKTIHDLHRHHIDELTFEENGREYRRINEVFDCWFESGSMPYAQNHYPFENKEITEKSFPADFIAEGLDQTRGWFYTLTVLSTALFNKPAFSNVIVNGIILAEDGNKMSKRLKNYPDPMEVINEHGADSIRLFLLNSGAVEADDLRFSKRGVEVILRQVLIPLQNSFIFLATYSNIYAYNPQENSVSYQDIQAPIDRWILSRLQSLIRDVSEAMDRFKIAKAIAPITNFIDELTNWYIRRSRSRFWQDEKSPDRDQAFFTLYTVLKELVKVLAPFAPFITESIYQELRFDIDPVSVHITDFPKVDETRIDKQLEKRMELTQQVVNIGRALRKEHKVKVRQPLRKAVVAVPNPSVIKLIEESKSLIKDELNVKAIEFSEDENAFVSISIKPNYKVLGKKLGPLMKDAKVAFETLSEELVQKIYSGKSIELCLGKDQIATTFHPDDVEIQRSAKDGLQAMCEGQITLAFDLELSQDLIYEGIARELINKINTMRKNQNFEVTDRISVVMDTTPIIQDAFREHRVLIENEVLAVETVFEQNQGEEWDINGELTRITLQKAHTHSKRTS